MLDEIRDASNTCNGLAALFKKSIKNAFDNVPFGDLTYGLLGSVPAEMLHIGDWYTEVHLQILG